MPSFIRRYNLYEDTHTRYAVVPVTLASSFLSSFVSGWLADALGRKKFFYVACLVHELGCIIEITGQTQAALLAGRIFIGISLGIFSMLVPLYQSEIAKSANRGRLITFYQIFVTMGFCLAFWISYATYPIDDDSAWRIPIALQFVPGSLMLVGLYSIPESPRWLIYKDRKEEALDILIELRASSEVTKRDIQMEFIAIVQDVRFDKIIYASGWFMSLLKKGNDNNRKRTLLGMGVHTFTQLSGINALLFYFPGILESIGVSDIHRALRANGIAGVINFVPTLAVLFYIDRWDRRKILITGAIAMAICMFLVGIITALYDLRLESKIIAYGNVDVTHIISTRQSSIAVITLLFVFIACFASSWGPIGWIYPAEIYPQMIRANAMGITTSCNYLFNLLISVLAPILFSTIAWGTYLIFGCMGVIMAITVYLYFPETKGRSLEEIQLIFSGALVDSRPDAHHPATAAEALDHIEKYNQ